MTAAEKTAAAMAKLRAEPGLDQLLATLPPAEITALAAAAPDEIVLKRWLKRRLTGEPIAYVRGGFEFAGRWFAVDHRAYITDPELTYLVDAVAARLRECATSLGRAPVVAELGVGCGALSIALKHAVPAAEIVGLELDPGALALAAHNARAQGVVLRLVESDLFDSWPADLPAPDLIFADPPWGDETTLYGDDRPAEHYTAMPAASAFPLGGRTGLHAQILQAIAHRGWRTEVWLNGGVLPPAELVALGALAREASLVQPAAGLSILRAIF